MTEFGEVNADLVSAPGLQATLEEADAAALEAAQDLVGGLGRAAAVAQHRHFLTIARAAADVAGDGALRRARQAPDAGPVGALAVARRADGGEAAVPGLGTGPQPDPPCSLIPAVGGARRLCTAHDCHR